MIITLSLMAALAFLSPYDPDRFDPGYVLGEPSAKHWFGTDEYGRDYFTRTMYGGRVSIAIGILAVLTSTLIGASVGIVAGYVGKTTDEILMRIVELFLAIPSFLVMMLIGVFVKLDAVAIIFLIGGLSWMDTARLIRAETLSLKEREYILYAVISGQRRWKILMKHVIPNTAPTIIVSTVSKIGGAILMESSLSYLGIGVARPTATWGSMLNNSQVYLLNNPLLAIIPGVLILLLVIAFNILGDNLQRVLGRSR
jgi:peptide/nickel transport system permease protein